VAMAKNNQAPSVDRGSVIYKALWHAIIEQALQPGTKLPEDAIGEKFGASRTIVRAALARLAAEGLVELRRNRGAAVATPGWNEARDIFDVRVGLERLVVTRLAGSVSREQIKTLKDHVDAEEQARGNNNPLSIRLATALCQRSGVPLRADFGALQPPAFIRMRGQRTSRDYRGTGIGRSRPGDRVDGSASRCGCRPRTDRRAPAEGA
jgi:DNA-binding FadR family transcriptional regulator